MKEVERGVTGLYPFEIAYENELNLPKTHAEHEEEEQDILRAAF